MPKVWMDGYEYPDMSGDAMHTTPCYAYIVLCIQRGLLFVLPMPYRCECNVGCLAYSQYSAPRKLIQMHPARLSGPKPLP